MGLCIIINDIHTKQLLALILSSFLFTSIHAARPLRTLQQVTANQPLTQCLESVVGRESVLVPGRDAGYENATIVFSRLFHSFPVAITFPKDTSDIQGIVICARAAGVQAVPRSGGHSYEGTHSTSLSLQEGASLGVFGGMGMSSLKEVQEAYVTGVLMATSSRSAARMSAPLKSG
jgi:hypothetical protein